VATGVGDGHEAVSSAAKVATGIRDGHEAVSTIATAATGIPPPTIIWCTKAPSFEETREEPKSGFLLLFRSLRKLGATDRQDGKQGRATACAVSSVAKAATGIRDGREAVSSIAMVATGICDGHEAVSSIAMVATGIRDGHEAVSTITTEATGIRDEHKAAAAPPAFELNKMDAARSNAGTTLIFYFFIFFDGIFRNGIFGRRC